MAFKWGQLSDRSREKLSQCPTSDPAAAWDWIIDFLQHDPQGQVVGQLIACMNRARNHHVRTVHPLGAPEIRLVGYSGSKGLENIRAELRIVGGSVYAYEDWDPENPADVGAAVSSYFGRYYGVFGPGVQFDRERV